MGDPSPAAGSLSESLQESLEKCSEKGEQGMRRARNSASLGPQKERKMDPWFPMDPPRAPGRIYPSWVLLEQGMEHVFPKNPRAESSRILIPPISQALPHSHIPRHSWREPTERAAGAAPPVPGVDIPGKSGRQNPARGERESPKIDPGALLRLNLTFRVLLGTGSAPAIKE